MARKHYTRSDETFKVLSGHEAVIARGMECDYSYLNKMKNGGEPDRYPPFRELFRAAAYSQDAPVEIWLNDLKGIYIKSRRMNICTSEISVKMIEKINDDAQALATLAESLRDGQLDEHECHLVLSKLAKNQETNERLKTLVQLRLGEIGEEENRK